MALLPILQYPDERLHRVAQPVTRVDEKIQQIIKDMAETMYAAPGIGLAATQVDIALRIIVIDSSPSHDQLLTLINPKLISRNGISEFEEGCLSVPGIYERVPRADRIRVHALDAQGQPFEREADGVHARMTAKAGLVLSMQHHRIAHRQLFARLVAFGLQRGNVPLFPVCV